MKEIIPRSNTDEIDRIYEGLLRYGRPAHDYSCSNSSSVIVQMSSAESDMAFLEVEGKIIAKGRGRGTFYEFKS